MSAVGAWYVDVCSPWEVRAQVGSGRYTRNITQVLAGPSSLSHGDNSTVRRGEDDDGRECARVYFKSRKRAVQYSVISRERADNMAPRESDEVEITDPELDDEYRWPIHRSLSLDLFHEDLGADDNDDDEEELPEHYPAARYRNSGAQRAMTDDKYVEKLANDGVMWPISKKTADILRRMEAVCTEKNVAQALRLGVTSKAFVMVNDEKLMRDVSEWLRGSSCGEHADGRLLYNSIGLAYHESLLKGHKKVVDFVIASAAKAAKVPKSKVTLGLSIHELGVDSIHAIEMIAEAEEEFDIDMGEDYIGDSTVAGVAAAIVRRVSRKK